MKGACFKHISRMFYFGPFRLKMFKFDAGGRVVDTFYKFVGNSLAEIVPWWIFNWNPDYIIFKLSAFKNVENVLLWKQRDTLREVGAPRGPCEIFEVSDDIFSDSQSSRNLLTIYQWCCNYSSTFEKIHISLILRSPVKICFNLSHWKINVCFILNIPTL